MKRFSHPFMQLLVLAFWALVLILGTSLVGALLGVNKDESLSRSAFLLWNAFFQLMTFALPVVMIAWMYFYGQRREFYRLDFSGRKWLLSLEGVGVLLLLVPLTDWLDVWNNSWHFSGAFAKLEESLRGAGEASQGKMTAMMKECPLTLNLFGLALVPAICEELFFRVGIQNLLQRWFKNPHAAVWVTAAVFSLAHGEVFSFLPRFLLGALLGYLYLYGRSLLVNVVAHFVNNAIVVAAYALAVGGSASFNPAEPLAVPFVLTLLCTLAAAALFYVAFLRRQSPDGKES